MIEWSLFYRMLGIPEEVAEPTYYDLLGLHPKVCTHELVDRMLATQRSRLRQNIPSSQFIPLILKFEQKKLERAASVLRDPEQRRRYDRYLHKKAQVKRGEKRKEKTKQLLLQKVRDIINSYLNPDKTLDDTKRPSLAAELRRLHIKQSTVDSLLERIPSPARETARADDEAMAYFVAAVELAISGGLLTTEAENKLLALAEKLNIDGAWAAETIGRKLEARNAHRGELDLAALKRDFENRVLAMFPNGSINADQYELLLALARVDSVPEALAREVLQNCVEIIIKREQVLTVEPYTLAGQAPEERPADDTPLRDESDDAEPVSEPFRRPRRNIWPILVPAVAIGILGFCVWLFEMGGMNLFRPSRRPATYRTGPRPPRDVSPPGRMESNPRGTVTDPNQGRYQPPNSAQGGGAAQTGRGGTITPPTGPGPGPQTVGPLTVGAGDIRQAFSTDMRDEGLLEDFVLTMYACYLRSIHLAHRSADYDELRRLIYVSNRGEELTQAVSIAPMAAAPDPGQSASGAPPVAPADPQPPPTRSAVPDDDRSLGWIERAGKRDTPEAARRLLDELRARMRRPARTVQVEARILRALTTMSVTNPNIPYELIKTLPTTPPQANQVAFLIARTLEGAAGAGVSGVMRLPFFSTPAQREECARWWMDNSPPWGPAASAETIPRTRTLTSPGLRITPSPPVDPRRMGRSRRRTTRPATPAQPAAPPPVWEPDPTVVKLLGAAAEYAELTRGVLKNYKWDAPTTPQQVAPAALSVSTTASDVGADLLNALEGTFGELSRLVTEHPNYARSQSLGTVLDKIEVYQKRPRMAACETNLQKAVVSLDASFELLKLLIRESGAADQAQGQLDRMDQERSKPIPAGRNVLYELRERAHDNLVLWDTLLAP